MSVTTTTANGTASNGKKEEEIFILEINGMNSYNDNGQQHFELY